MRIRPFAVISLLLGFLVSIASAKPIYKSPLTLVRSGVITNKSRNPRFSFRARRGQIVTVRVSSSTRGFCPLVVITSPSGKNLIDDKQMAHTYTAKLTESGRYRVRVGGNLMATNAGRGRYRLEVFVTAHGLNEINYAREISSCFGSVAGAVFGGARSNTGATKRGEICIRAVSRFEQRPKIEHGACSRSRCGRSEELHATR